VTPLSPEGSKQGLESSKWAAIYETAPELRGGNLDEDDDTTKDSASVAAGEEASAATPSGKRNLAGQLAGIHEQIKQLDELSEEFLEEHQKMARTLSRVDDKTTTTQTGDDTVEHAEE
jgi:hypothetical protein